jgi:hypothetical protein
MSETDPIEEQEQIRERAVTADPATEELEGGGYDTDLDERPGEGLARENVEAELDDRLEHHGGDRL